MKLQSSIQKIDIYEILTSMFSKSFVHQRRVGKTATTSQKIDMLCLTEPHESYAASYASNNLP